MNILKLALLGSLRIAFFGFLKVVLCAYTLFLPDAAFAGAACEDSGQVGDAASCPTSALVRQNWRLEEGRISGSS